MVIHKNSIENSIDKCAEMRANSTDDGSDSTLPSDAERIPKLLQPSTKRIHRVSCWNNSKSGRSAKIIRKETKLDIWKSIFYSNLLFPRKCQTIKWYHHPIHTRIEKVICKRIKCIRQIKFKAEKISIEYKNK